MSEDRTVDWIRRNPIKAFVVGALLLTGVGLLNSNIDWSALLADRGVGGVAWLVGTVLIVVSVVLACAIGLAHAAMAAGAYFGVRIYQGGTEKGLPRIGAFYGFLLGGALAFAVFFGGLYLLKVTIGMLFGNAAGGVTAQ